MGHLHLLLAAPRLRQLPVRVKKLKEELYSRVVKLLWNFVYIVG